MDTTLSEVQNASAPDLSEVEVSLTPEVPEVEIGPAPKVPEVELAPTPKVPEVELAPTPKVPEVELAPTLEVPEVDIAPTPEVPEVDSIFYQENVPTVPPFDLSKMSADEQVHAFRPLLKSNDFNAVTEISDVIKEGVSEVSEAISDAVSVVKDAYNQYIARPITETKNPDVINDNDDADMIEPPFKDEDEMSVKKMGTKNNILPPSISPPSGRDVGDDSEEEIEMQYDFQT